MKPRLKPVKRHRRMKIFGDEGSSFATWNHVRDFSRKNLDMHAIESKDLGCSGWTNDGNRHWRRMEREVTIIGTEYDLRVILHGFEVRSGSLKPRFHWYVDRAELIGADESLAVYIYQNPRLVVNDPYLDAPLPEGTYLRFVPEQSHGPGAKVVNLRAS